MFNVGDSQLYANVSVLTHQELHAHLNGSVSFHTIEKLLKRKPHLNIEHSMTAIGKGQRRTLDECVYLSLCNSVLIQKASRTVKPHIGLTDD